MLLGKVLMSALHCLLWWYVFGAISVIVLAGNQELRPFSA